MNKMQNGSSTALGGINPGLLAFQGYMRSNPNDTQVQAVPGGNPALAGLPLHPAFPLQGYPFYPGGLLAALRPQALIHTSPTSRDSGPTESKSPGGKSFTIDAILGDHKQQDHIPGGDDTDDSLDDVVRCRLTGSGPEGRHSHAGRSRRLEMSGHPYPGQPGHGLPHCPAALRYGHFPSGCRNEKKQGHMTGSVWKGKSKRVRTIFTPEQLERLESEFERQQYMVGTERYYLAASLNLTEAQVKVWFQNRRIKWRKQNLEQQHAKLANFELFNGEEGSDSDAESVNRKLLSPDMDELRGDLLDDVMTEDENKNSSFDSGISVENKIGLSSKKDTFPVLYINNSLHNISQNVGSEPVKPTE